jgi:hypothetical protein
VKRRTRLIVVANRIQVHERPVQPLE